MVQAANLGNGDDLASIRTLCRAPLWAVFGEREVCPGSMVVVHIGRENAAQVSLVEDVLRLMPHRLSHNAFGGSIFDFRQGVTGRQEDHAMIRRPVLTVESLQQITSEMVF